MSSEGGWIPALCVPWRGGRWGWGAGRGDGSAAPVVPVGAAVSLTLCHHVTLPVLMTAARWVTFEFGALFLKILHSSVKVSCVAELDTDKFSGSRLRL